MMLQSRVDRGRVPRAVGEQNDWRPKFDHPQPTTARPKVLDFFAEFFRERDFGCRQEGESAAFPAVFKEPPSSITGFSRQLAKKAG